MFVSGLLDTNFVLTTKYNLTTCTSADLDIDLDLRDAHKAQRISSYVDEDAHDISQKSRRKDRELLNNITQKLVGTFIDLAQVNKQNLKEPSIC